MVIFNTLQYKELALTWNFLLTSCFHRPTNSKELPNSQNEFSKEDPAHKTVSKTNRLHAGCANVVKIGASIDQGNDLADETQCDSDEPQLLELKMLLSP
jgi:hypothetical protein